MNPEPTFTIEINGVCTLTVSDLWPDGDAPENPTVEQVMERVNNYAWNLPCTLRVNGKPSPSLVGEGER